MRRRGLSHDEAIRRLEFQDAVAEVDDEIHALLGDRDGGMWFDHDDGGRLKLAVVQRDGEVGPTELADLRDRLAALGLSQDTDIVLVDYSEREMLDAHGVIADQLVDLYRAGKISSGLDPSENALHVELATSVTAPDRARLRRVAEHAPVRVLLRETDHANLSPTPE